MTDGKARTVSALALASIALTITLNGKPDFTSASRPPRGMRDPALAIQLARNVREVDAILSEAPSPDREAMRIKQYVDFAFIACYAGLFIALGRLFGSRLALAGAAFGIAAAMADVIEDIGILRILDVSLARTTQPMIDAIRGASYVKWTLAWIALAIFGALFWHGPDRLRKAIGAAFGAAAAIGVAGLFENALLFWAELPMGIGLALAVFLFVTGDGQLSANAR